MPHLFYVRISGCFLKKPFQGQMITYKGYAGIW